MNNEDAKLTLLATVIIVPFLCIFGFLSFREKSTTTGYITKMWWSRTVYELEDYQTYDCDWVDRDDGRNNNDNETVWECEWVTHTRTTNTWSAEGSYPLEPYWPTYKITEGRYESKTAYYYISVKTDDYGEKNRSIGFGEYQSLKPEKVLILHLNYFDDILFYEVK